MVQSSEGDWDPFELMGGMVEEGQRSRFEEFEVTLRPAATQLPAVAIGRGTMPFEKAQAARARRIPNFLSEEQVQHLERVVLEMRAVCGLQAKTRRGELRSTVGASWTTTFLHTNGEFQKREPELVSRIRALAAKVNSEEGWSMPVEEGNLRCIEHHEYLNGGGLADHHHRDTGSLVTIDLMLSEASSGGEFCTLEADGLLREHDFHRGDAIVFPSHKPHSVGQITSGRRSVLIVEIWPGLPRGCAHRCVGDPEATCDFGVMDSARENMRYLFAR